MATFADHFNYTDSQRQPLLNRIRQELRTLDNNLRERITPRQRIAYNKTDRKIFLEIKVQRHAIVLHMIEVPDPNGLLSAIPDTHEWRHLSRRAKIENNQQLLQVLPLIKTAWVRG
jgi:predicted transport protein